MSKGKKRQRHDGGADAFVVEGDAFPESITVELWRRLSKGKRELAETRRYDLRVPPAESVPAAPVLKKASAAVKSKPTTSPGPARSAVRKPVRKPTRKPPTPA